MTRDVPVCPFTILIDDRERAGGYRFTRIRADADKDYRPLYVPTQYIRLVTGDYTISGFEDQVTVERKSLADLYHTLGQDRERFQREHERMAKMQVACVVVESSLENALANPPEQSQLHPRAVFRTYLSWQLRYGVHWIWAPGGARGAEKITFQVLRLYWLKRRKQDAER